MTTPASAAVANARVNQGTGSSSGLERWQVITVQDKPGRLFAEGLWNGVGVVHDSPVIDPVKGTYTNVAHMEYEDGTLTLHSAGLTKLTFLGPACIGIATIDGHFHADQGTGRYENVTGTGTIKGDVYLVFAPTGTACSAAPIAVLAVAHAEGIMHGLPTAPNPVLTVRLPV